MFSMLVKKVMLMMIGRNEYRLVPSFNIYFLIAVEPQIVKTTALSEYFFFKHVVFLIPVL